MERLIFEKVEFNNLVKDTKYIIKRHNKAYYTGKFSVYSFCMGEISHFCDARDISGHETYVWKIEFYNDKSRTYHKIVQQKEKIQSAMELRAVNIILRSIIGDDTFNY
jgi:hypothetical protein